MLLTCREKEGRPHCRGVDTGGVDPGVLLDHSAPPFGLAAYASSRALLHRLLWLPSSEGRGEAVVPKLELRCSLRVSPPSAAAPPPPSAPSSSALTRWLASSDLPPALPLTARAVSACISSPPRLAALARTPSSESPNVDPAADGAPLKAGGGASSVDAAMERVEWPKKPEGAREAGREAWLKMRLRPPSESSLSSFKSVNRFMSV